MTMQNDVGADARAVEPSDYNNVVDTADLLDVKMIKSTFDVQPDFFILDREALRFTYNCESSVGHYDPSDGRLVGTFRMEAGCKQSRKWLLHAKATYLAVFLVDGSPTEEAALAYLERVGKFTCYPYFRAHFAGICSGAGAEMPPLPVMRGNVPRRIPTATIAAMEG